MRVIRSADAPDFDLGGSTVAGLASPARGAAETMTYRVRMGAGSALPEHRHDHEEVFHLASGALVSILDGEEHERAAGDTMIIPAGTLHHAVAHSGGAELLVAMPVGTLFVPPDGEPRLPPWGE